MRRLEWKEVAGRLVEPKNYWLHTSSPNGAPAAAPVWAVTVDDVWYCYTERSTAKARNLAHDPRALVHLESGADVVIVHGLMHDIGDPAAHLRIMKAFEDKYSRPEERPFLPSADPAFDVLYSLEPRRAMLWSLPDTEASTRRWSSPATPRAVEE